MALTRVDTGLQSFPDFNRNQQLANAQIYIGVPGLDPAVLANQYQAYVVQEDGTQVAVAQPIRTSAGGVPTYLGSPVQIAVAEVSYSIKVLNAFGSQIYYQPDNTDIAALNASQVSYNPSGAGAISTTVEIKLQELPSFKDSGASGDGIQDDTAEIQTSLDDYDAVLATTGEYLQSAIATKTSGSVIVYGLGGVLKTTLQVNLIGVGPTNDAGQTATEYSGVIGVGAIQPEFGGSGTGNNHNCFSFAGVNQPISAFNYGNVDIGSTFGYGPNTLTRRGSIGGVFVGNRFKFTTMGLECFSPNHAIVGNVMRGDTATSHCYRMAGYTFSPAQGIVSAGNVGTDASTLISMQNSATFGNHVGMHGSGMTEAIQMPEDVLSDAEVQRHNIVSATLKDNTKHVFMQGGEYNIIEVNAHNSTNFGLDLANITGLFGSGKFNWFKGILRTCGTATDRAVNVGSGYTGCRFDLGIYDSTTFGMVINANSCTGELFIDDADTGIRINGNNCHFKITTRNCVSFDVDIAGSNNTLEVSCTGNVRITGNDNILVGDIDGTITNTGLRNSFSQSGTFVPAVIGSTTAGTYTAGTGDNGNFRREGRIVHFTIGFDGTIVGAAGTFIVTGLPYRQSIFALYMYNNTTAGVYQFARPRTTSGANANQISLSGLTYASGNNIVITGAYVAE